MSTQRLSRKEIKHEIRDDAFRHAVGGGYDYVRGHGRNLALTLAGLVVVAGAVVGWRTWHDRREAAATELLGRAIKTYDAPVVPTGAKPDDAEEPSFADEASRAAKAKELFERLEHDYRGTGGAAVGQVYIGRIRLEQKDAAGARKAWEGFLDDHPRHLLAGAVRVSLLDLDRQEGKGEKVVERLRADLEKDDKPLPEDVMLYELGTTLERLGRRQEAHDAFQRIADEHPDSPWASKATTKARELAPPPGVG
jgi:tetratricopeptide (TPR) repeat protein